ncbi:MAG: hypothetical protein FJX59_03470 [Alphaproteobacteria bacterium]|nr:hypothetical protein [Alphaproteobacteria bacterium]
MVFQIDPDKPDVPALAPIALWMGVTTMIGAIGSLILAFSGYDWVKDVYAFAAAVLAFLIALILIAQGKILELLAVVSFRVKVKVGVEGSSSLLANLPTLASPATGGEKRPPIIPQKKPERVIHIPESQAREQGVRTR